MRNDKKCSFLLIVSMTIFLSGTLSAACLDQLKSFKYSASIGALVHFMLNHEPSCNQYGVVKTIKLRGDALPHVVNMAFTLNNNKTKVNQFVLGITGPFSKTARQELLYFKNICQVTDRKTLDEQTKKQVPFTLVDCSDYQ